MRFLKYAGFMAALAGGLLSAPGFSLLGPFNEEYQVPEIGYNIDGDIGAPKNIGEEWRWTTPVLYYAFDQSFVDFFGTNGINEVEAALEYFNVLTNAGFSALDPNQFPLEAARVNPRAQELFLLDLKSETMSVVSEELGLAEPERYVWTLRARYTQPNRSCPFMIYWVVMRNFDPITFTPSAYVNGVLYTYQIQEICTGDNPLAWTYNFPVDPTAPEHLPVASGSRYYGSYYVALSRDDVGGLKYMYRTNNVNWESLTPDSEQFTPNRGQAQLAFSSNLWTFAWQAMTNDAPTLQALYPGLIITGTTNIYTNIWQNQLVAYFTNAPWMPVDSYPQLWIQTNRTLTVQTYYRHTFGNVYTGITNDNGQLELVQLTSIPTNKSKIKVQIQTTSITNAPWLPIDSFIFRQDTTTVLSNGIAGDFFILPTNACDVELIGLQATLVNHTTNSLVSTTNNIIFNTNIFGGGPIGGGGNTNQNGGGVTNVAPYFAQDVITTERNRVWLIYPIECGGDTNNATLRQGVDRIEFRRANFDSLIGRLFAPITNYYTSMEVTNSQVIPRKVRRVVTTPDIVFGSQDLADPPVVNLLRRTVPFASSNAVPAGLAGPGTMSPPLEIRFNRVVPLWIHAFNSGEATGGLAQSHGRISFIWGSYGSNTNEPIVYPIGTRPGDVEDILLFQILTPSQIPEGQVNRPYQYQLEVSGGQQPYSWAPAAGSPPPPAGITISSSGLISGTPTTAGDFTFSVTVTEAGARTATRTLTLHINAPTP